MLPKDKIWDILQIYKDREIQKYYATVYKPQYSGWTL